jgi:Streptomyces sporulation and cell division protein, SsgA
VTDVHARGAVAWMPARSFVLADRLDVDVSACAATVWYLPADPGAVHLLLARDAEDTTTVAISLDLLTGGMCSRVDRGQTTIWPCREDDVVCVGLRGRHHAVVELPRTVLATFLAEISAGSNQTTAEMAAPRYRGCIDDDDNAARRRLGHGKAAKTPDTGH